MESKISNIGNEDIKVSIIVPIYNAESFIATCINSILNQSYSNIELILVDDGSSDNSSYICNELSIKDNRINYIKKDNGGVSSARNRGIKEAHGDYICFVDADDTIDPSMIKKMISSSKENNADLCVCGFKVMGSKLVLNDTASLEKMSKSVNKEKLIHSVVDTSQNRVFGYAWRCLYKRAVIINYKLSFPESIRISEDYMFFLKYLFHAENIAIVPENLYYYKINNSSVTSKYMPSLHSDMNSINEWIKENVCCAFPNTNIGYHCCKANTYLRAIQNLCRQGTTYTLFGRIREAYRIKKKYKYQNDLWQSLKDANSLSIKNKISYMILLLFQEWLYIVLFSIKSNI